jgi:hypothetical protein
MKISEAISSKDAKIIYLRAETGMLHHDGGVAELLNETVFALDSYDNS